MPFEELTGLRLFFGLIAASVVVTLVALALVPGLFALLLYYRGLRGTPASAATIGELVFPMTALILDYLAFGAVLTTTQWLGIVILVGTMITMALVRTHGTPTGVEVPELLGANIVERARV